MYEIYINLYFYTSFIVKTQHTIYILKPPNCNCEAYRRRESSNIAEGESQCSLGVAFAAELLKRVRKSTNKQDATYYCYVDELYNTIFPHALVTALRKLKNDENEDELNIAKMIVDFIITPINDLKDGRFSSIVAANITMALQHSSIFDKFPISKFVLIKLVKESEIRGL